MRTRAPAALPLFRSELQAEVLAALVLDGGRGLTIGELAERTGATRSSLHRELDRLLRAGILEREVTGRTGTYSLADSPLREPLAMLIDRTLGVEQELVRRLDALGGVDGAAIYGSWASGEIGPASDIDVLVVGDVEPDAVFEALRPLERRAGREINVKLYSRDELRERLADGSGFLRTILDRPLRMLVGELPGSRR
jgi:predicted nucleotidyltransferase